MKLIHAIYKNIKNLFAYFVLIAIYFLFVNIEAQKEQTKESLINDFDQLEEQENSAVNNKDLRISIPVVPYKQ